MNSPKNRNPVPEMPLQKAIVRLAVISAAVVIPDQLTKLYILHNVPMFADIVVIPGFFSITHIHNPGGAFGVFAGHAAYWRILFFIVISVIASIVVLVFYFKTVSTHVFLSIGFALIFGGAAGNLIDRIRFGEVVDFLDFYINNLHWPAFNVADSAITIGVGIFLYHVVLGKLPE